MTTSSSPELPPEVQQAAEAFGAALRALPVMQPYFEAVARFEADPEAVALEAELTTLYEALVARQRAGEFLSREDTEQFYALRTRVFAHPLIAAREAALAQAKAALQEAGLQLSMALGVDYPTLAQG
ncbi:MAG TPA: YlbF family regulator [Anaerolineae bacterium]|nr:YlbF family regulator [Anaerolineae bacterium]HQK13735.1 YlbF family regulator [Anaerolineae bacterium]